MNAKLKLTGLKTTDYIHPDEKSIRLSDDFTFITKGLDVLNDLNVAALQHITLGSYIEITETTSPRIKSIVDDVCSILDYKTCPRVYICHQASQTLFCAGTDNMQITLSDYVIDHFDDDMLYFAFGNLISMFKAGHVKLTTVCSLMIDSPKTQFLELPLNAYLRAADLSSDRGGLLACQNFAAAAKVILWNTGIPIKEMASKTEADMIELSKAYLEAIEGISPDWLTVGSVAWKKANMESMPTFYKLKELLEWYKSDYFSLLSRWKNQ